MTRAVFINLFYHLIGAGRSNFSFLTSRIPIAESISLEILKLLARPRGFEPLTLGLEMRGFVVTNSSELSRFVTLQ